METNVRCRCRLKTIKSERKKKRATKIVTNSGGNPSKVNLLRSIGVSLWNSNSSDTCLWLSMRLRLSGFHVKSMFDRFSLVLNCINSISSRCRARGPSIRLKQREEIEESRRFGWSLTPAGGKLWSRLIFVNSSSQSYVGKRENSHESSRHSAGAAYRPLKHVSIGEKWRIVRELLTGGRR